MVNRSSDASAAFKSDSNDLNFFMVLKGGWSYQWFYFQELSDDIEVVIR